MNGTFHNRKAEVRRSDDVCFVMLWQEHFPLVAWHAPLVAMDVALTVQFMDDLLSTADVSASIAGMLQASQQ